MNNISAYFQFDLVELILLGVFILFIFVELFFYLYFYKSPLKFAKKQALNNSERQDIELPSVSVLIVSSNAAHHLEKTLPSILGQDYPNFEVIVVNNGSTDETDTLITALQTQYSNLYATYLPHSRDNIFGRKKLAMTIGAKAAKNDVILFTESFCRPDSDQWIGSMVRQFSKDCSIVAGHSYFFEKPRSLSTRLIAYDNLMYALQYISMIIRNKPFSATFRNLAIRRKVFFDHKGFASVLNHEHGEELFLNQIVRENETTVCLDQNSFVGTVLEEDETFVWKGYKIAYQRIKKRFKGIGSWIFSIESFSRYALLVLWIALLVKSIFDFQFGGIIAATLLSIILTVIQLVTINKVSKLLKSGKYYFLWPILNLIQPIRNIYFKSRKDKSRKTVGSY